MNTTNMMLFCTDVIKKLNLNIKKPIMITVTQQLFCRDESKTKKCRIKNSMFSPCQIIYICKNIYLRKIQILLNQFGFQYAIDVFEKIENRNIFLNINKPGSKLTSEGWLSAVHCDIDQWDVDMTATFQKREYEIHILNVIKVKPEPTSRWFVAKTYDRYIYIYIYSVELHRYEVNFRVIYW